MPHSVSPEPVPALRSVIEQESDAEVGQSPLAVKPVAANPTLDLERNEKKDSQQPESSLHTMFDDDDDDAEMDDGTVQAAPTTKPSFTGTYTDPEVMKAFYQRLFPFRYLFQWLNHSPTPTLDFAHREFAFTLPGGDIYLRYQSFATAEMMRKQCVDMIPSRFEIGPVYSTNPRDRKTLRRATAFRPISKELCFDIDMTDYDEIRTCCTGASICQRCWSFMKMSIKVLDQALREDFGFEHILWVYSGRRGVHAWICDKRARDMDDAMRRSIAGYFELIRGGDSSGKKVNLKRPLHPHIEYKLTLVALLARVADYIACRRSLATLRDHFRTDILIDQDPWASAEKSTKLLSLLPDKQLSTSLAKKWEATMSRSSTSKWKDIDDLASAGGGSKDMDTAKLREAKQDIVLEYTYPRLDAEVSKKLNHLLKSPFCVHPGTGRICVPIDTREVEDFDPLDVPTVTELLGEIDEWHGKDEQDGMDTDRKIQDWEKTRLRPYVEYFRAFVNRLLKDEGVKKRTCDEIDEEAMEF